MIFSRFQGDLAIRVTSDGADMTFKGGQPVMDQGLHNAVLMSLFTKPGWWGNAILPAKNNIGSDYEEQRTVIDIETIDDINRAAEAALQWMLDTGLASEIDVQTFNPSGQIETRIRITPPGSDVQEFLFTKNGLNWIGQSLNPAEERL